MYKCSRSECEKKRRNKVKALYILVCGHSICDLCIIEIIRTESTFVKCDQCSVATTFTQSVIKKVSEKNLNGRTIPRLNEYAVNDLPMDAYSLGMAVNCGSIEAIIPVETISIDLDGKYNPQQTLILMCISYCFVF